ncbi:MAG: SDR family oxidoreductase [Armatimonadetes bacterium]|nr:SDR family oxidoreductase [Armatimonadota bacterium]MDE2205656.1 SDR family oxidoreductase [Armatimonadota bacterium]
MSRPLNSCLVTGGAGFIGSHLVHALLEHGARVRILDNFTSGNRHNLHGIENRIEVMEGDVRDAATCHEACSGMQTVFHLAALVSVPESVEQPHRAHEVNINGTLNILMAARETGAERVVFSSSSAVYGDTIVLPTPEDTLPVPTSPYGLQKLCGEHYCRLFFQLYGLETVSLRYFNVYGARQDPNSAYAAVIPRFLTRLASGQHPVVYGNGEQTRDFLHASDVARANVLAATVVQEAAIGNVFNIAGGGATSINQLLNLMREVLGVNIDAVYEPARIGDIHDSVANTSRAATLLEFHPHLTLSDGLAITAQGYRH